MDDLRNELDKIDEAMRSLFEARLDVVQKVAEYKLKHQLEILDESREAQIIDAGIKKINNPAYKDYYQEFIELQLKISKDLQAYLIKK